MKISRSLAQFLTVSAGNLQFTQNSYIYGWGIDIRDEQIVEGREEVKRGKKTREVDRREKRRRCIEREEGGRWIEEGRKGDRKTKEGIEMVRGKKGGRWIERREKVDRWKNGERLIKERRKGGG